MDQRPENLP